LLADHVSVAARMRHLSAAAPATATVHRQTRRQVIRTVSRRFSLFSSEIFNRTIVQFLTYTASRSMFKTMTLTMITC